MYRVCNIKMYVRYRVHTASHFSIYDMYSVCTPYVTPPYIHTDCFFAPKVGFFELVSYIHSLAVENTHFWCKSAFSMYNTPRPAPHYFQVMTEINSPKNKLTILLPLAATIHIIHSPSEHTTQSRNFFGEEG